LNTDKSIAAMVSATNSALCNFALLHSVGLGLYPRRNHVENGSGTLFKVGGHYFIATAAHCVRDLNLDQIRVAYRDSKHSDNFALRKKGSTGGTKGDPCDVAYLELDGSALEPMPAQFLTLDQIALEYNVTESMGFLFGFPSELVPKDAALKRQFRLRSLGLLTLLVKEGDPVPDFVDKNTDVVVKYPEQAIQGDGKDLHPVPHPEGISGGSIWIYNPDPDTRVIGSHNARFIGIQKSWFRSQRIAIGNKVIVWLRLLVRDYPDLRETLDQKFGVNMAR